MNSLRSCRRVAGFTLIEVMVGLAVGGMVLASIHQVIAAISTAAHSLAAESAHQDQTINGRRWLRSALGSIRSPSDSQAFEGRPTELAFSAATRRGEGWFVPERIRLRVTSGSLVAERSDEGVLVIVDSVSRVAFDYLLTPGAQAHWVGEWISVATTPLAVRIRIHRRRGDGVDTLLLVAKDRR